MRKRIARIATFRRDAWALALTAAMVMGGTGSMWRPPGASAGSEPRSESTRRSAHKPAAASAASVKPGTPIQAPGTARKGPQLLHFALYDAGIYPGEVHAKQGPFKLALEDYSGGTTGVMLDNADTGANLTIVKRDRDSWRGATDLTLHPGRYFLHDVRSPDMKATLVIEP